MKCDLLASLFFLLNLFPCKQCWNLLKLQCVFAKKNFDHYYKALLKCYLLAFLFFAKILSLQTCFVLLTNFCSIYPSQRSTISFTFVQGIHTSQNTKTMKKNKKNPFDPKLRSDSQLLLSFLSLGNFACHAFLWSLSLLLKLRIKTLVFENFVDNFIMF